MQHTSSSIAFINGFSIRKAAGIVVLSLICAFSLPATAQPFQFEVFTVTGLDFGSFFPATSTGSVTVSPDGIRTSSGVTLIGGGFGSQAIFDVKEQPNRTVHISWQATTTLRNGPYSLTLTLGPTDKIASSPTSAYFITRGGNPFLNPVNFGGTLTVGSINDNPPGNYSGTFVVTFHQE